MPQPPPGGLRRLAFNYLDDLYKEFMAKFRSDIESASRPYAFVSSSLDTEGGERSGGISRLRYQGGGERSGGMSRLRYQGGGERSGGMGQI
jgi:hypothetical protein